MNRPGPGFPKQRKARRLALVLLARPLLAARHGRQTMPASPEKLEATRERLQRGQYLVNQVMACGGAKA
jgi:hypothetical protein